jgi:Restriction endonuclease
MIDAQPFKGGKKGGDGGVDGFLYIKPDGKKTEKVIVSVKGGQSLNPAMVKDLIVTVDQEGAKMGVFLTLEAPTKGMVTQAASAGFFKTDYGQFPKIQARKYRNPIETRSLSGQTLRRPRSGRLEGRGRGIWNGLKKEHTAKILILPRSCACPKSRLHIPPRLAPVHLPIPPIVPKRFT